MPRKPREERRRELVAAASRVIVRDGLHAASVRAIAAEADLPLATFHYVFSDRDEAIGETYRAMAAVAIRRADTTAITGPDIEGVLRARLERWFEGLVAHPREWLGLVELVAYCSSVPSLSRVHEEVQAASLTAGTAAVESLVSARPELRLESPREVAALWLHLLDGLSMLWVRTGDELGVRAVIDSLAPVFARSISGASAGERMVVPRRASDA